MLLHVSIFICALLSFLSKIFAKVQKMLLLISIFASEEMNHVFDIACWKGHVIVLGCLHFA